jgi:hypothetical protein
LRLEPNSSGVNVIAGDAYNSVATYAATIGGGGNNQIQTNAYDSTIGGGVSNQIQTNANYSTISGGVVNKILTGAANSTIGGGYANQIQNNATESTIGGGGGNQIQTNSGLSTIGGGYDNTIQSYAGNSTIGGGWENLIEANAYASTIGGGEFNTNTGDYASIPGGDQNVAGSHAFAAGHRAKANNNGSFVWADSTEADFADTANNQFLIRAAGGVGIGTNNPQSALHVVGTVTATAFKGDGSQLTGISGGAIAAGSISNAAIALNAITASQITNGQVVKSLDGLSDAVTLAAGANVTLATNSGTKTLTIAVISSGWNTNGNAGTSPNNGNFLGTTDNQPLEIHVNKLRAMRYEPGGASAYVGNGVPTGAPNVIGGSPVNFVASGVVGAVIAGGGATNYNFGIGYTNSITADFGTIGGGNGNTIQTNAYDSTIGGGGGNTIQINAYYSTIGGGDYNTIQTNASYSTIGGGGGNTIQTNASDSTIGGGNINTIQANANESTIGGGIYNTIQTNSGDSTIGGGNDNTIAVNAGNSTIGGGLYNTIQTIAYCSAIGGGNYNTIQTNAYDSTIGGGLDNTIQTNAYCSTIGGGNINAVGINDAFSTIGGGGGNTIQTVAPYSTIGGGLGNQIQTNAGGSTIGGGNVNTIQASAFFSTIGGGQYNTNTGYFASIPGGDWNVATNRAFAAGHRAKANHTGSFVWADSTEADFADTGNNQFDVRASGGVLFSTGSGGANQNVAWTPGSGSWSFTSDRNAKENFKTVDAQAILDKIAKLPMTEWNYKGYGDRHVGPMAQDFHAAFPFNANDKMINSADEAGVSLAAIQGLNQKLDEKDTEIQDLKARLEKLEQLINTRNGEAK